MGLSAVPVMVIFFPAVIALSMLEANTRPVPAFMSAPFVTIPPPDCSSPCVCTDPPNVALPPTRRAFCTAACPCTVIPPPTFVLPCKLAAPATDMFCFAATFALMVRVKLCGVAGAVATTAVVVVAGRNVVGAEKGFVALRCAKTADAVLPIPWRVYMERSEETGIRCGTPKSVATVFQKFDATAPNVVAIVGVEVIAYAPAKEMKRVIATDMDTSAARVRRCTA